MTGPVCLIYSLRSLVEPKLPTRTVEIRQFIGDIAAAAVCCWTGYFLCHTWQTLDEADLVLLGVAVIGSYGGALGVAAGGRNRVAGVAAAVLAAAAAWYAGPLAWYGVALLFGLGLARAGLERTLGSRLLFGLLLAAAALFVGLSGRPVAGVNVAFGSALAGYVAIAGALRGPRPVERGALAIMLAAMLVVVLVAAGAGLAMPFGLLASAFAVWLAVYLVAYGRHALKECNVLRLGLLGENALAGAGLFAGALLALHIPRGERSVGEMAWPVLAGAFSFVLLRAWPYLRRSSSKSQS